MLKKCLYIAIAALTLSACKGDYTDWKNPVDADPVNPQSAAAFKIESACSVEALVLTETDSIVKLVDITLPAGYHMEDLKLQMKAEDKDYSISVDEAGLTTTKDVQACVTSLFGVKQEKRTMTGVLNGHYLLNGTATKVRFESEEMTFVILPLAPSFDYDKLWMPGAGNGWNHGVAPVLFSPDMDGKFTGYAYMDGEFKFTKVADWKDELNNSNFAGTCSANIDLGDKAGGNIKYTGDAAFCYVEVNVSEGTIKATPCSWGIIGGFDGNSWGTDQATLVYDTEKHCLQALVDFGAGTEWKFRRDEGWDINYGGALDALVDGGDNITSSGTNMVQLFIERNALDKAHAVLTSVE